MFLSSLSVVSSNSWILLWIFMELNSISLCSTMFKESIKKKKETQSAMMYLTIQLISSIILIVSTIFMKTYPVTTTLAILSIMMKAGVWPLHLWYLKTLETMEMMSLSMKMVMTWQKVIPFLIMLYFPLKMTIIWMSILNMVIPLNMLKTSTSLKSTLILSSMNNNSWFIFSIISSMTSFTLFFMVYSMSMVATLDFFKKTKSKMYMMMPNKMWESMIMLANMSSIPPTIMFTAKVIVVLTMITIFKSKEIPVLMMLMGCIFTYFYMSNLMLHMMKYPVKSQMMKKKKSMLPTMLIFSSLITAILLLLGKTSPGFILME